MNTSSRRGEKVALLEVHANEQHSKDIENAVGT